MEVGREFQPNIERVQLDHRKSLTPRDAQQWMALPHRSGLQTLGGVKEGPHIKENPRICREFELTNF